MGLDEADGHYLADPPAMEWVSRGVSRDFYLGRSSTVAAVLAFPHYGATRENPAEGMPAYARTPGGGPRPLREVWDSHGISYHCVIVHLPTGRRWDSTADILGEGDGPIDPVRGFDGTLHDHEDHL